MISVSGKIWTEHKVNKNLVEKFKQDYGLGNILSKLIILENMMYQKYMELIISRN
jgi:hypothetical protein